MALNSNQQLIATLPHDMNKYNVFTIYLKKYLRDVGNYLHSPPIPYPRPYPPILLNLFNPSPSPKFPNLLNLPNLLNPNPRLQ